MEEYKPLFVSFHFSPLPLSFLPFIVAAIFLLLQEHKPLFVSIESFFLIYKLQLSFFRTGCKEKTTNFQL